MRWILLLILTGCSFFGASTATVTPPMQAPPSPPDNPVVTKKLVEFGWDKPRPAQLTAAQLDGSVFDGVMFASSAGDRVIVPEALPVKSFDDDIAALKKISSGKLRNSFYVINVNADTWDWFDDARWGNAETNLYQFARVAKEGGLRGLMFDPEVYQFDLWAYKSQPRRGQHSFKEFETQMRKRGAQTMRAFERAYPGVTVLSLYLFSAFEAAAGATYEAAHAGLEEDGSLGLFAAFAEGMLEAATDEAVMVDGFEPSYYHLRPADFDVGRKRALTDAQLFVTPELRQKFQRQVKFANAVYVDGVMNLFDSARFFGYYLKNDDDRRALLAHNVYHGLRSSDEFVWVYAESVNWWQRTIETQSSFTALEAAVKRGRQELLEGRALSDDPTAAVARAEVAFNAKVAVGGDILGRSGLNIKFGALQNNCGTWANARRWSCIMPGGSSFTVMPTAEGASFQPASRSFVNLVKDNWSVSFTAK
jgi:hypothetical protein